MKKTTKQNKTMQGSKFWQCQHHFPFGKFKGLYNKSIFLQLLFWTDTCFWKWWDWWIFLSNSFWDFFFFFLKNYNFKGVSTSLVVRSCFYPVLYVEDGKILCSSLLSGRVKTPPHYKNIHIFLLKACLVCAEIHLNSLWLLTEDGLCCPGVARN